MEPRTCRKLADEFIQLGKSQTDLEMIEGCMRSAIEKSYYYVFLVLRSAMNEVGLYVGTTRDAHQEVIDGISVLCTNSKDSQTFTKLIASLRYSRNQATYNLSRKVTITEANVTSIKASTALQRMANSASFPQLSSHIMNYL